MITDTNRSSPRSPYRPQTQTLINQLRSVDKSEGLKETEGKLEYELDFTFVTAMAERMATNKGKYPPFNWKKKMDTSKLKQSLLRHVLSIMEDIYKDDNREYGHIEAAACNLMMILYQLKNHENSIK